MTYAQHGRHFVGIGEMMNATVAATPPMDPAFSECLEPDILTPMVYTHRLYGIAPDSHMEINSPAHVYSKPFLSLYSFLPARGTQPLMQNNGV